MKSKLSGGLHLVATDIYNYVTPLDKEILTNSKHDFVLIEKLAQWKEVTHSSVLETKDDIRAFYAGTFSKKC